MSEFLGNIAVEIIGSLIDKAGTFVAGQAGNCIDWKVWKNKYKFTDNESDFLDRYAEALVALSEAGKPKELLQFYGREHVIRIIHDYWYGELDEESFKKQFGELTQWFTLEQRLADFNPAQEVFFFLTHYRKAVNLNRTAGATEVYQLLLEIRKEIRQSSAKNTSELYDQVFIYANRSDQAWVNRELLPRLDEIGWKYHTDFRTYTTNDFANWSDKVRTCRNTIIVYSQNLSEDERRLVDGFISLERPEVVADKLLPFKLDDAQVPEKLREAYDFTNPASSTAAWRRLGVSFAQIAVEAPKTYPPLASNLIDITSLPNGGLPGLLFGRQTELALLDQAWEDPNCHVICFTAQGGQGKSALINRWLDDMGKDNYRGAERVLATSFYSQGTGERVTSADQFINAALKWFEERAATEGVTPSEGVTSSDTLTTTEAPTSPWEKGKRLARLIAEHRCLLILDGLEPLQEGGVVDTGKIKDPALFVLVRELARRNNGGLCIITSRLPIAGLERQAAHIQQENLEHLSSEAGKHILRFAGVRGTDVALENTVESFGNHALAVNLLSAWLYAQPGHKIEAAKLIPDLPDVPVEKGKHPRRVIAAFERWLIESGKTEAARALQLLGLFDRPISKEVIAVADPSLNLPDALAVLRRHRLIYEESRHDPEEVDCHPLVREHFEEVFQKEQPEQWKAAHGALYEYYKGLPEKLYGKYLPDTLEEMEPLFLAVRHGCKGGLHQEVMEDVFWDRIRQRKSHHDIYQLGAYINDLTSLSEFFEVAWSLPSSLLSYYWQNACLHWARFDLQHIGKSELVMPLFEKNLTIDVNNKNWKGAASTSNDFSIFLLFKGEVVKGIQIAYESILYANLSKEANAIVKSYSTLAFCLHYFGEENTPEFLFNMSEKIYLTHSSRWVFYLPSLPGFHFCEYLLDINSLNGSKYRNIIQQRAFHSLEFGKENENIFDISLSNIILGKSYLPPSVSNEDYSEETSQYLENGVAQLREITNVNYLSLALLARAAYHRHTRNYPAAEEDLEEVLDIAEPSGMRLHLTDYHLEMARLRLAQDRPSDARPHVAEAARLIEETGYHRRDKELEELQKALAG